MKESEVFLDALIENNNKVIMIIYKKFYPKIESYIRYNSGSEKDAQDIFHDALMYLIVKHRENKMNIKSFESYLFGICRNRWNTAIRNNKVIKSDFAILKEESIDLSQFILEQERLEFYKDKFQMLSDNCKEVLGGYFSKMSYEELMRELSYSTINTVRQRVFKCKAQLIKLIKKDPRYKKITK